jgi:glycosyltransferase involved in cell wall biosynthesis
MAPGEERAWREKLRLGPSELIVVATGRLSPEKGYAILLEALARLQDENR